MTNQLFEQYVIDYIEIYAPIAKPLAYWHSNALGFNITSFANSETGLPEIASYVLESNEICLVITSTYPTLERYGNSEVSSFVSHNNYGVKRIALRVPSVSYIFETSLSNGAIPIKFPTKYRDGCGYVEEASIKLYDQSEITFIDRSSYSGGFKPGYKNIESVNKVSSNDNFLAIDHVAAEVRINESSYWTNYLKDSIGTQLVQKIAKSDENISGMILNISQSFDEKLTLVISEPDSYKKESKILNNIKLFGSGIHHIAFSTKNLIGMVSVLENKGVEFVNFPSSYYDLLRQKQEYQKLDIDILQKNGILVDVENDAYLLQKFIKPISDRPYFIYEIVERVNRYKGFALKNINILKKAEEVSIKTA